MLEKCKTKRVGGRVMFSPQVCAGTCEPPASKEKCTCGMFASHKSISVQHVPYLPLPAFSSVFAMLHVDHLVVGVVIVDHVKTRTNIGGVRSHGHKLQGDLVSFGRYTVGSCENSSLPVTCVCEKLLAPLGNVFLKTPKTLSSLNVRGWQLGAPRTVLRWPHLQEQP